MNHTATSYRWKARRTLTDAARLQVEDGGSGGKTWTMSDFDVAVLVPCPTWPGITAALDRVTVIDRRGFLDYLTLWQSYTYAAEQEEADHAERTE